MVCGTICFVPRNQRFQKLTTIKTGWCSKEGAIVRSVKITEFVRIWLCDFHIQNIDRLISQLDS
jgi:hypothetical protein